MDNDEIVNSFRHIVLSFIVLAIAIWFNILSSNTMKCIPFLFVAEVSRYFGGHFMYLRFKCKKNLL